MLENSQTFESWGKSAFSSFAMSYSTDPQLNQFCSSLVIKDSPATLISVGKTSPVFTYTGAPVVLLSLDACKCACNFMSSINMMQVLPEQEYPIQALLTKYSPTAYNDILLALSILWDFSEQEAPEVLQQRNEAIIQILKDAQVNSQSVNLEALAFQIRCQAQNRGEFFYESLAKELDQFGALVTPFLNRFGQIQGQVQVLDEGSPVVIGAGEYLVIEHLQQKGAFFTLIKDAFESKIQFDLELTNTCLQQIESNPTWFKSERVEMKLNETNAAQIVNQDCKYNLKWEKCQNQTINVNNKNGFYFQFGGSCEINGKKVIVPVYYKMNQNDKIEAVLLKGMQDDQIGAVIIEE
ncbi:Conserved_hypothetical protein [Hexamita inflata]|uniref:Uncharacterized protein n=1 Tax=Hexamita inflata TaxID=28002 RepID=A0AA86RT92_9EUKA|nr:Conserved hypothetical protein [Hexamita inflata]